MRRMPGRARWAREGGERHAHLMGVMMTHNGDGDGDDGHRDTEMEMKMRW